VPSLNKPINQLLIAITLCYCLGVSIDAQAFKLDLDALTGLGASLAGATRKVPQEEEVEIGGNLISGLLGAAPLVDDVALQKYVNDVGSWVAAGSERPDLPWLFAVIESDGINAFAAPGGYIVVTRGLYSLLENEAQLAAVLAHEISHVVRKHHLQALQKSMQGDFLSKLAVMSVADDEDRAHLDKLVNAGLQLYVVGLDRVYEYDADQDGVVLAARAGYDPYAMLDVLTTIDSINPESSELTVMLNTHPPTADRLDQLANQMDGRMDQYASGQTNGTRFQQVTSNR